MADSVFFVTGTSGTGKTTVLRELSKRGFETIGIDEEPDLTCWVDKETNEPYIGDNAPFDESFLQQYQWMCDVDNLKKLIEEKGRPLVICGSCDNVGECMKLCDVTLLLECLPEVFLARIEARTDNEYGKTEAAKAALLSYYQQYNDDCISAGAVVIDASRSIDYVVDDVLSHIESS